MPRKTDLLDDVIIHDEFMIKNAPIYSSFLQKMEKNCVDSVEAATGETFDIYKPDHIAGLSKWYGKHIYGLMTGHDSTAASVFTTLLYRLYGSHALVVPDWLQHMLENTSLKGITPADIGFPYPAMYFALPHSELTLTSMTEKWGRVRHRLRGVYVTCAPKRTMKLPEGEPVHPYHLQFVAIGIRDADRFDESDDITFLWTVSGGAWDDIEGYLADKDSVLHYNDSDLFLQGQRTVQGRRDGLFAKSHAHYPGHDPVHGHVGCCTPRDQPRGSAHRPGKAGPTTATQRPRRREKSPRRVE
jgi:hypothetical protein